MLKMLLDQLNAPAHETRIEVLCALVMLEETLALDVLSKMWTTESHPEVKQAISWAGSQINAAKQRGYSTAVEMAQAFRYDLALANEKEQEEQRKLDQLQTNVGIEQLKQYGGTEDGRQTGDALRRAATAGLMGAAFGISPSSTMMNMATPTGPTMTTLSDGTTSRPQIGKQKIVPPRPTDSNIAMWLKRLTDTDIKMRTGAIIQLRDFNNPTALGPLGMRFATDADPGVRQLAQQTGKMLYFNALYWQEEDLKNPPKPKPADSNVADILAKAQANRQKRSTK
jgi:hypothetical protein